jgi:DNA repair protein RecN (Recombination protein N)
MPAAQDWPAELRIHTDALASLSVAIQRELSDIDADPARLEWLDQRLATYDKLKRKYGGAWRTSSPRWKPPGAAEGSAEPRPAKGGGGKGNRRAGKELQTARAGPAQAARAAAENWPRPSPPNCRRWGSSTARSASSSLPAETPAATGIDRAEFGFAPNVGEPMRPLRAIASSGEISRVMLGIKVVLADADKIPLLVFDEIDANVGGETAHAVGRKLAQAATRRQVIAITHLPPVAACGAHQFAVRKSVRDGRTHRGRAAGRCRPRRGARPHARRTRIHQRGPAPRRRTARRRPEIMKLPASSRLFHAMENVCRFFPQYGKLCRRFSTLWKIFFHGMEKVGGFLPLHSPSLACSPRRAAAL